MPRIEEPALRVISLGWGVQSWALAAMSALGVLPHVDYCIHSDTTYERAETYAFADKWRPWLIAHGIQVMTVKSTDRALDIVGRPYTLMPLYTDGGGQLKRQCTSRWKIEPARKRVRSELKRRKVEQYPGAVDMWLGITLDEALRSKPSRVGYIRHSYPFVNMSEVEDRQLRPYQWMDDGKRWTRLDVINWLHSVGLDVPVKSSCVQCPYHSASAWRELRDAGNGNWQRAIALDEAVRGKRRSAGLDSYLTPQRVPLVDMDLSNQEDAGQLDMFETQECEGGCFL